MFIARRRRQLGTPLVKCDYVCKDEIESGAVKPMSPFVRECLDCGGL